MARPKKQSNIVELKGAVLFPGAIIRATQEHEDSEDIVVVPVGNSGERSAIAVMARVLITQNSALYEGLYRVSLNKYGKVEEVQESKGSKQEISAKLDVLKGSVKRLLDLSGTDGTKVVKQFTEVARAVHTPEKLVDILISVMPFDFEQKVELLNQLDLMKRIDRAVELVDIQANKLSKAVTRHAATAPTPTKPGAKMSKQSRERMLKSQLKSIRRELESLGSELDDDEADEDDEDGLKELKRKLKKLNLGEEGKKIVGREMKRLERMHPSQAEYNVCRTYLETICDIPWGNGAADNSNRLTLGHISKARTTLDEDHFGLEKAKKRLVEYLAVNYLNQQSGVSKRVDKSPILLLVGPPGVGKTSLAKSVANALGRKLHRISLGGLRDEAELKGHRRTYVGAMPGEFTKALIKTGVDNPVVVLDEIDKLAGPTQYGDPTGVMLEVLDPESNREYHDRYVSFPIDLSKVLFIATANSIDTISPPLLDRMETIHIEGYTYREKEQIAASYLIPKQTRATGLSHLEIPPEVIRQIATKYTREAGVRNLEREIGTLCRGKAVEQLDESKEWTSKVELKDVEKFLGLEKYHDEVVNDKVDEYQVDGITKRRQCAGVVNGLAYTGSGNGGLLTFEATSIEAGSGKLKLTGKLGEVISESAQIALTWVKANCNRFNLEAKALSELDIHLHAPAGAIPKDGPSAGVAMTIALVSLLTNRVVPGDIAMTGEMTLRGKVLPVGGIREKLLGAHLAGVTRVLVPYNCQKQVEEECSDLELQVVYVKYIWDALKFIWPEESLVVDSLL